MTFLETLTLYKSGAAATADKILLVEISYYPSTSPPQQASSFKVSMDGGGSTPPKRCVRRGDQLGGGLLTESGSGGVFVPFTANTARHGASCHGRKTIGIDTPLYN